MILDQLAQRYGRMPHEILKIDYADYLFDTAVAEEGMQFEIRKQKELEARLKSGARS